MSFTKSVFHLVFSTRCRRLTITKEYEAELYRVLCSAVVDNGGVVYAVNGVEDHVHMLVSIPATVSLSDFVKSVKQFSSSWVRDHMDWFPAWEGWSRGFGGFSCSANDDMLERVLRYVEDQKEHHRRLTFDEEARWICECSGIRYEGSE